MNHILHLFLALQEKDHQLHLAKEKFFLLEDVHSNYVLMIYSSLILEIIALINVKAKEYAEIINAIAIQVINHLIAANKFFVKIIV